MGVLVKLKPGPLLCVRKAFKTSKRFKHKSRGFALKFIVLPINRLYSLPHFQHKNLQQLAKPTAILHHPFHLPPIMLRCLHIAMGVAGANCTLCLSSRFRVFLGTLDLRVGREVVFMPFSEITHSNSIHSVEGFICLKWD